MKKPDCRSLAVALGLALFASITMFAQSEKIRFKMVPEPNQTVRMRAVQDMELNMSFESETPSTDAPPEPMKMVARAVFAMTQKVGAPDKEGNVSAEVTYDEVTSEMLINGQPLQIGDKVDKFIGKKITTTFNSRGEMIDLKIPPDLGLPEESLKQLLKSIYGNLPQTPLGVGEVATAPLDFTIPLPIPGAPPMKMDGLIKSTLVSVEKDATSRTAKFDQTMDGKLVGDLEVPGPTGQVKMSFDFKLNGGGGMLMNVDKGFLKSSDSKMTFGGKLKMAGESGATNLPTINFQGTMKVTVTGSN
ncbi:MAG TPA: hypothetical protein VKS99_08855 [Blastocatellia bacterium]|nr:hypothetical protein [Blastocatellia bacterium]